jgi:hypothetical protein
MKGNKNLYIFMHMSVQVLFAIFGSVDVGAIDLWRQRQVKFCLDVDKILFAC